MEVGPKMRYFKLAFINVQHHNAKI